MLIVNENRLVLEILGVVLVLNLLDIFVVVHSWPREEELPRIEQILLEVFPVTKETPQIYGGRFLQNGVGVLCVDFSPGIDNDGTLERLHLR